MLHALLKKLSFKVETNSKNNKRINKIHRLNNSNSNSRLTTSLGKRNMIKDINFAMR